jgi:TRAP-type C4-dicarboxylate transport system permease small subunit
MGGGQLAGRLDSIERGWSRVDIALATLVLALEALAFAGWVILKGLSMPADSESSAGWVLRALLGATALGSIGALLFRRTRWRPFAALAGVAVGVLSAKLWLASFVGYTSNLLNWLEQASTFTLFGGLRGLATRLTLVLFLLGGLLATGAGRHITVDLVARAVPERWRHLTVALAGIASAVICTTLSWGFFDHIAIENFGAKGEASATRKLQIVATGLSEHAFILHRQLKLDARSLGPVVFGGQGYASFLDGREWNAWLEKEGFFERYGSEAAAQLRTVPGQTRAPMVVVPVLGEPRGELANSANLFLPVGLLAVALRFVLHALRALVTRNADPPHAALGEAPIA